MLCTTSAPYIVTPSGRTSPSAPLSYALARKRVGPKGVQDHCHALSAPHTRPAACEEVGAGLGHNFLLGKAEHLPFSRIERRP